MIMITGGQSQLLVIFLQSVVQAAELGWSGRCISEIEHNTEHNSLVFCGELSLEEKSLALLGRIDFGQELKKVKKEEDGSKEEKEEIVQLWPWQGLVEHLQQAHQELAIILDMITYIHGG